MATNRVTGESLAAYRLPPDAVVEALGSNAHHGLGNNEAQARLEREGPNALAASRPVPGWRKLLAQFREPLVILLLVAAAISFILWLLEQDSELPYEAIAILAIVLLNAAMGFFQQARAEQSVNELQRMTASQA
ncbi:MAG: cation-translocating P-type ATPase, partial [Gammaproteobacteria bacterium]